MSVNQTRRFREIQALQTQTGLTTNWSIHDLRAAYYGLGTTMLSQNDAIRAWLKAQLNLTSPQSLTDLWRLYFLSQGTPSMVSLRDMADYFFANIGYVISYINDNFSANTIANYTVRGGTWSIGTGTLNATAAGGLNWVNTFIEQTAAGQLRDFDATGRMQKPAGNVQFVFRGSATNGYGLQVRDTNTVRIEDFGVSNLAQTNTITWVTGNWYRFRVHCFNNHIQARVWNDGSGEPSTWDLDFTNSLYTSGFIGFSVENGTTSFDDLLVVEATS